MDADWIVNMAVQSLPFVRDEIYLAAIQRVKGATWPFNLCVSHRRPIWAVEGRIYRPLLMPKKPLSTIYAPQWCTTAFMATGFSRDDCGRNERMRDLAPWFPDIDLRPEESLDSDTEADIELLKLVADGLWLRQQENVFAVASQPYGA